MKRLIALLVLASCVVLAASAASSAGGDRARSQTTKTITIGAIFPLTGQVAIAGTNAYHGDQLAVDVLNGKYPNIPIPKLKGWKIRLVTADSQGDPQIGAAAVSRLVQTDGAKAILGAYQSAVSLTAARQAELFQVPFVNGSSGATSLSNQGLKWWFRTGPDSKNSALTWFSWLHSIKKQHPVKTYAIIVDNDAAGKDFAYQVGKEAHRDGYKSVAQISFTSNATDLSAQVLKLKSAHPDVVFTQMFLNDSVLLLKTMAQLDYTPPALLAQGGGWDDPTFLTAAGKLGNDNIRNVSWGPMIDAKSPLARTVDQVFTKRFGVGLNGDSAREFTAVITLGEAIQKANSDDPGKIRAALSATNIPGKDTIMPWAGIKFDSRGQNLKASYLILQAQNNKWVGLYPSSVSTGRLVWPLPQLKVG